MEGKIGSGSGVRFHCACQEICTRGQVSEDDWRPSATVLAPVVQVFAADDTIGYLCFPPHVHRGQEGRTGLRPKLLSFILSLFRSVSHFILSHSLVFFTPLLVTLSFLYLSFPLFLYLFLYFFYRSFLLHHISSYASSSYNL